PRLANVCGLGSARGAVSVWNSVMAHASTPRGRALSKSAKEWGSVGYGLLPAKMASPLNYFTGSQPSGSISNASVSR
ncbi:MAG: hypothetical protein ABSF97_18505, partial [Candidatus Sulfotelmatobacter sp.]